MHAKTKDTMLDRSQRDLEQARLQLNRYEREIESLKSQLTKARIIQDNQSVLESPSLSQRSASPRVSPPIYNGSRPSTYTATAEKENRGYLSAGMKSSGLNGRTGTDSNARTPGIEATSGQLAGGVHDWKNAADLTAKLRERIESMKRAEKQR